MHTAPVAVPATPPPRRNLKSNANDPSQGKAAREIGVVTDVLQNTAQDIYQVKTPDGREVLIPAVADFVKDVNIGTKSIRVALIPGMAE